MLKSIPHNRLLLGLGFLGVLQVVYLIKKLDDLKIGRLYYIACGLYSFMCFGVLLLVGRFIRHSWPLFLGSRKLIIALAAVYSLIIFLLLIRRFRLAAGVLLLFSILSVLHIHPLYRGLGTLNRSQLTAAIQQLSEPSDTWAVADSIIFENFGQISGRDSISGIQFYPDLNFWNQVGGKETNRIYNRYAHIVFNSSPLLTQKVRLTHADVVQVTIKCDPFFLNNVDYLLSSQVIDRPCTKLIKTLNYPVTDLFIYKIQH